jgi:membrane protease YdiL (CAAX protease family)
LLTLAAFAGMMAVSFGQGVYALFSEPDLLTLNERQIKDRLVNEMLVFEGLDTVIVLLGILAASRPLARAAAGNRPLTWAVAAPGFLVLLGVNLGYHQLLKWLVSPYQDANAPQIIDISLKDGWWAVLLVCVQPAVVEELFFRYLLFGHLRPHLGLHGAVWLTAVIFGMAHLGNIPGWPVLILLGAGLGYARAYSGTLALPILLHFLHNFAVLVIDYAVLH